MAATAMQPRPPQSTGRMTLTAVRRGRQPTPDRLLIAGVEGVGKSTFGADAPGAVFLAAEEGVSELDVARFPQPESFADVRDAVRQLTDEAHEFKTLVIDTLDWLEPIVHAHVCAENGWANLEAPGYGKGYAVALDAWRTLIADIERMQAKRGLDVILLAHVAIRPFSNPAGQDFSRYEMKLHKGAAALWREWTKANLFAMHEEFAAKDPATKKVKGVSTGRRVLYTQRTAAWDAKNRYNLPPELPLSYAEYVAARTAHQVAAPATLRAEADALLATLAPDAGKREQITTAIAEAGDDATRLAKIVDRLRTLVAEKE